MHIIEQAVMEIESGDVELGMAQLTQYLKMANEDEMYEIAMIFSHFGYVDNAMAIMHDLIATYPYEGQLKVKLAELYIEKGEDDEAIECLAEVSVEDESYGQALLLSADLFQAQGFDEVAEYKLMMAKEMMPTESVVDFALAELYFTQGEYRKAIPYYEYLLTQEEEFLSINLHLRLAECLSVQGEYDEAIRHYEQGLDKKLDLHSLFGYGFTCYQGGYFAKAVGVFEKITALEKDYPAVYVYLGKALEGEGRIEESLKALKKAIFFDETNVELYVEVAKMAARVKEYDEAEMHLRRALELDPEYMDALLRLVGLLLEQENYDEAIYMIQHANDLGMDDPQLIWDLAFAKYEVEEYQQSLKLYDDAYNFFKDDIIFLTQYGQFLEEEGRRERAIECYRRILQLDPTLTEFEERLYTLGEK